MSYFWRLAPALEPEFQNQFPELKPIVLQLLLNRGLTSQQQIDEFLNPDYGTDLHDPFLFVDMEKVVTRILTAIEKRQKIVVYGDYDADGVCATAILASTLKALGADIEIYIPFRETEGYGLNLEAAKSLIEQGTKVLVTVDCGISNFAEVEALTKAGVEVIVTDHHQEPIKLPQAFAIINQNTSRDTYPYKNLAGSGVAFKVAQGLLARHNNFKVKTLPLGWEKWLLDLVAIGTIADMMLILGENRTLVNYGLVVLQKTKRLGLQELMNVANTDLSKIDDRTVGFQIAPRLNAAGRLEHANTAYELLVTEDREEAKRLAQAINTTNQQRQQLTETITQEANQLLGAPGDRKLLAVVGEGWPTGVVGLIAGRLSDAHYRPALVISRFGGEIIGSGRSIEGFNIVKALQQADQYLARYGGHAQACGFTLKDEASLKPFLEKMEQLASEQLSGKQLVKGLEIDAEVKLEDINWELFEEIEKFRPFGEGNRKPRFISHGLTVVETQSVGKDAKHLRLMVNHEKSISRKMIGFGFGHWLGKIKTGDSVDAVFEVDVNEWNGNRELQLKLVDLKLSNSK